MIKNLPNDCCGCTACESVCGHMAIQMVPDTLGFMLPKVDEKVCIDCGLCEAVCPFISFEHIDCSQHYPTAYAARHKEIQEVETSRSGAVFMALSSYIISEGGIVYGATITDNCNVAHQKTSEYNGLTKFKGSKYIQSDMRGVIKDLRKELQAGKKVLFSGTPCQTAAVRNAISETKRDNLYLVDIVCHGVASPKLWSDYIGYLEKREHCKIVKADFRDKAIYGWDGLHRESFVFDDNSKHTYPITFYQPFLIREACNSCPYSNLSRPSDLTLGDLWGWENVCPNMNEDNKGISLLLVNTSKGKSLLDNVEDVLYIVEVDLEKCLQSNLQRPTPRDSRSDTFMKDYAHNGFEYVLAKYYPVTITEKVKYKIKRVLGKA